jgi:hypothetical protein
MLFGINLCVQSVLYGVTKVNCICCLPLGRLRFGFVSHQYIVILQYEFLSCSYTARIRTVRGSIPYSCIINICYSPSPGFPPVIFQVFCRGLNWPECNTEHILDSNLSLHLWCNVLQNGHCSYIGLLQFSVTD